MLIRHLRQSELPISANSESWCNARMKIKHHNKEKAMQMLKAKLQPDEGAGAGRKGIRYQREVKDIGFGKSGDQILCNANHIHW